jgi:uncharacterized protein with von Willebrand factor type A (vWA) domain
MLIEKTKLSDPSDKGLVANIIRFSHLLRENGVSVTLSSVLDAVRGLEFIDMSDPNLFHGLLLTNFVYRKEDINLFNELFFRFWFSEAQAGLPISCPGGGIKEAEKDVPSEIEKERFDHQSSQNDTRKVSREWIACYSPDARNQTCELDDFTESRELYDAIKKWLQPLRNRLSRRSQYTIRGKEITLRRILRKNMQFGGELILLDFKKKKIKKRRVVFFCDVSGSMDVFTLMLLHFVYALKRMDSRTEIFFFSTDLSRWTHQFDSGDYATNLSSLPEFVLDWGGGTRIGHCLKRFNEIYGKWMVSSRTVVVIFSDGWDRGEADILESQMAYLNNKAYKIIWLNPLMGTKDYQPICRGMSAALPYVDYFLPMANIRDLHYLGKTLEKMIV